MTLFDECKEALMVTLKPRRYRRKLISHSGESAAITGVLLKQGRR